MTETDTFWGFD